MTEKRKFLVRGVLNSESGATKFSKVVKAHSGQDAEEYVRRNIQEAAVSYSVNPMIDVEFQEAPTSAMVPWFGGYGIPG